MAEMTTADERKPRKEVINHPRCKEVVNYRVGPSKCRRSDPTTPSLQADFGRALDAHTRAQPLIPA
jgi:hypothetical protein